MTEQARFAKIVTGESIGFKKVIEAITNPEYKNPADPKGKTAMEMASALAHAALGFLTVLESGKLGDGAGDMPPVSTTAEASEVLMNALGKAAEMAKNMDDATWDSPAVMVWGGKPVWEDTRGGMAWGLLFDAVHHRGQLTTFLRPMGSKVPSIYGPSGDDMGGMAM